MESSSNCQIGGRSIEALKGSPDQPTRIQAWESVEAAGLVRSILLDQ